MSFALSWPSTLASRLSLIFLVCLILAQTLSFGAQYYERYESTKTTMLSNLEHDVSTSIAILNRLPAAERVSWLKRLHRRNYSYRLSGNDPGMQLEPNNLPVAAHSLETALGNDYDLVFTETFGPHKMIQAKLLLSDGSQIGRAHV